MKIKNIKDRFDFKYKAKELESMSNQDIKIFLIEHNEDFLDEYLLRFYIKYLCYDLELIFDKKFKEYRFRPDILIKDLKLIIEFDGPTHYTDNIRIAKDYNRDQICKKEGYEVVRIPNFIQFKYNEMLIMFKNSDYMIGRLKEENVKIFSKFPNGFWSKTVVLPSSFCYNGCLRYLSILDELDFYLKDFKKEFNKFYLYKLKENNSILEIFNYMLLDENIVKEYINSLNNIDDKKRLSKELNIIKNTKQINI